MLQRLPRHLQQQALLRIDRQRLARRNAEEVRVEFGRASQKTAGTDVGFSSDTRLWIVQIVPAAFGREFRDHLTAFDEHAPQVLGRGDPAWIPAGHADNGNGLVAIPRRNGDVPAAHRVAVHTDQPGAQQLRQPLDRRIVERDRGGQFDTAGCA